MWHMCLFKRSARSKAGHSAVETALMLPWLIFSFMGTLDFGFATYSLISLQSAARVAAVYASSNSVVAMATAASPTSGPACTYALAEMRNAPNVGSGVTTCTASDPVQLSATYNNPAGSDGFLPSETVSVTYTIHLLAIPIIMPSQITITRQVECPLRG
jgi:Flp pilus assembly protein TadG